MSRVIESIENVYRFFLLRKYTYTLNRLLFQLSIRGLGIMNYENDRLSGEFFFLKTICRKYHSLTCLDVGANVGKYSNKVKQLNNSAKIYALEPHPQTFEKLEENARRRNYSAFNLGLSDTQDALALYDYKSRNGSTHASLYKDVIEDIHGKESVSCTVDIDTLDNFVTLQKIAKINLLKIDVEGNELKVISGARNLIENQDIDIIHFEFNEMNIVSRTFLKDIIDKLPKYSIFRMLPYGIVKLDYEPLCEIFAYQNIVAISQKVDTEQLHIINV